MNNIDLILSLIEVRADHLSGCSFMYAQTYDEENYTDTPSAAAREDLYDAQASALRDLVAEIRAGMVSNIAAGKAPSDQKDFRYVFIQEMSGTMTASVHNSLAELHAREARFQAEHEAYFESNGNGVCHGRIVHITPRKLTAYSSATDAALDVRWVMITDVDRHFEATIHDTEDDLQVAIAAFEEEYKDWIESQDAVYGCHEILIPPKPQFDDDDLNR